MKLRVKSKTESHESKVIIICQISKKVGIAYAFEICVRSHL